MFETLIVVALVLWSALVVFKKVFPKTSNSFFSSLSTACANRGWTMLSKWLKPAMASGCGGNCGCDAQEDAQKTTQKKPTQKKPTQKVEVQAVKWK